MGEAGEARKTREWPRGSPRPRESTRPLRKSQRARGWKALLKSSTKGGPG